MHGPLGTVWPLLPSPVSHYSLSATRGHALIPSLQPHLLLLLPHCLDFVSSDSDPSSSLFSFSLCSSSISQHDRVLFLA
jgi:hypothetical protein